MQNEINFLERQKEILLVSYNSLKSSNPQKPDEKRKERIEFIKNYIALSKSHPGLAALIIESQLTEELTAMQKTMKGVLPSLDVEERKAYDQEISHLDYEKNTREINNRDFQEEIKSVNAAKAQRDKIFNAKIAELKTMMVLLQKPYAVRSRKEKKQFLKDYQTLTPEYQHKLLKFQSVNDLVELRKNRKIQKSEIFQKNITELLKSKQFDHLDDEKKSFMKLYIVLDVKNKNDVLSTQKDSAKKSLFSDKFLLRRDNTAQFFIKRESQKKRNNAIEYGYYGNLNAEQRSRFIDKYLDMKKEDKIMVLNSQYKSDREKILHDLNEKGLKSEVKFISQYEKKSISQMQNIVKSASKLDLKKKMNAFIRSYVKLDPEHKKQVLDSISEKDIDAIYSYFRRQYYPGEKTPPYGRDGYRFIDEFRTKKELDKLFMLDIAKLETTEDQLKTMQRLSKHYEVFGLETNTKALLQKKLTEMCDRIFYQLMNKPYNTLDKNEKSLLIYTYVYSNEQQRAALMISQSTEEKKEIYKILSENHFAASFTDAALLLLPSIQKAPTLSPALVSPVSTHHASFFNNAENASEEKGPQPTTRPRRNSRS